MRVTSHRCFAKVLLSQILALFIASQTYALGTDTHARLNEYLVKKGSNEFSTDLYLKNELGIPGGIETQLRGHINGRSRLYKVWEWIRDGGILEDSPWYYTDTRSRNHYHEPLSNQGFSGIGGAGLLPGESAIFWFQRPLQTQSPYGFYSWNDVRGYFYDALMASDQTTKERNLAETFRGLGQLMHLVQDMSVPEHTRDDGHYIGSTGLATHYEQWVARTKNVRIDSEQGVLSVSGIPVEPFFFDYSQLRNPSPFAPLASVPVAMLFDTNRYAWSGASGLPDPSVTKDNAIGLSEYTNANFMSPDTMFDSRFPFPAIGECIVTVDGRNGRQYFSSRGQGEQVDHLAARGWMGYWRQFFPGDISNYPVKLDSYCYEEYAQKLLSRAAGYSASLLKYFFRGELAVQSFPIYTQDYHAVTGLKLRIRNVTPSGETLANGTFSVSCTYESAGGEEISLSSMDYPVIELLHGHQMEGDFVFGDGNSLPIERFGSLQCMLAFRGDLGNETAETDVYGDVTFGAVVGKSIPLSKFNEPWDETLTGNHAWYHTTANTQPVNGQTYNAIGSLIKENIRWAGHATPRVNESYISFKPAGSPDGLYISPNARLQFKIDELSINAIPPAPPGMTSNLQALELHFNQGRHFQFSREGQFMYFNDTTAYATFPLGVPVELGIRELFLAAGIEVPQPLYLEYINFIQQLWMLEKPSSQEHHQRMRVDYIRIVEPAP
jgi:hypothetical protein